MTTDWPTSRGPIRVLLADDQALFRRGISAVLRSEADIEVIAEAQDGQSATEQAENLAPDVVLMDVRMPGGDGIEAARQIKAATPVHGNLDVDRERRRR